MNKEYIIKDSVTTLAIAIADHLQNPNETYVSTCLDKVNSVFKPQWIRNQVTIQTQNIFLINTCIQNKFIKNVNNYYYFCNYGN